MQRLSCWIRYEMTPRRAPPRHRHTRFTARCRKPRGGGQPGGARVGCGGQSVAPLSRRQYCAPLNKSQMEQRVFFHLAALKAKQPRATWGGRLHRRSGQPHWSRCWVWSGLLSDASCECDICRDLNQMGPDAARRFQQNGISVALGKLSFNPPPGWCCTPHLMW